MDNLTKQQIEIMALNYYPKKTSRDLEGEWYDVNEFKGRAFINGVEETIKLQLKKAP